MRLADFITANVESILQEWEKFARSIWPGDPASPRTLRDHAEDMIVAVAHYIRADRSHPLEPAEIGAIPPPGSPSENEIDHVSALHAFSRAESGFNLRELVGEYQALRKTVVQLWHQNGTGNPAHLLEDLIRFNEAIDLLLGESVLCYTARIEQSRELFLGILGHDLRNPLNAVSMCASMIAESPRLDENSLHLASNISASVTAMDRMILDLLDFAGTRLGTHMQVWPGTMDLGVLCQEVLAEMKTIHRGRTFTFEQHGQLTGIWDPARLRQLISNLLGNAVQHGFSYTPVVLSATAGDGHVRLSVRNQGPPIPDEAIGLIFEPLQRPPADGAFRPPGSIGLGLYIAREVARAHGTDISVSSTPAETSFTVDLPRRSASA